MKQLLAIATVLLFVSAALCDLGDDNTITEGATLASVHSIEPTWGHIRGNELVIIRGCGFSTYGEVSVHFAEYPALRTVLIDDTEIHAWTPIDVEFQTVPLIVDLYLLFDGNHGQLELGPLEWYWGPYVDDISPTQVVTAGGGTLTISGFGFDEYTTIQVLLDDVDCISPSAASDTSITCSIPAGEFNQNAIISVYFNGNPFYFQHDTYVLHYGPILTSIEPTCGRLRGGDTVTLTGTKFEDQFLQNPRVEFFIGSEWVQVDAAYTGSSIVVTTPFDINDDIVWGSQAAYVPMEIFGSDPDYSKLPGTTFFHYGPLMFSVEPTVGYIDGGDIITIHGCGFSNYTDSDIDIFIGGVDHCATGTETIVSDNIITCVSAGTNENCYVVDAVSLEFQQNNAQRLPINGPGNINFNIFPGWGGYSWWWGPYVEEGTLSPVRGPYSVTQYRSGQTITVTYEGFKLGRDANTLFANPQCRFVTPNVLTFASVDNGQSTVTCDVPAYQFDTDSIVYVEFDNNQCKTDTPTPGDTYHWGPYCYAVTPTFGYIEGLQPVTLVGEGFQDEDWDGATIRAEFCIEYGLGCNWENDVPVSVTSDTAISTRSPDFALAKVNEIDNLPLGANRYFGDDALVYLYFDTVAFNYTLEITCDYYRYGPIVTDVTADKGPMGPRADHSPNQLVTITGAGFEDPLVSNRIRVAFGEIHGEDAVTVDDTTITVKTLWGATAKTDHTVFVYFETCNTTEYFDEEWNWGPIITEVEPIYGYNAYENYDITIRGYGFEEWLVGGVTDAVCRIDRSLGNNTQIVDDGFGDFEIICNVPFKQFGTQAEVSVIFGHNCRDEWDYTQVIVAYDTIWYRPEITDIDPTVGYTSGGQIVTVYGYGLGGWNDYSCFFGHWEGAVVTAPSSLDDFIVCRTPTRREDYDSDVRVHIQVQLDYYIDDEDQENGLDRKVWAPLRYHYGPLCYGLNPSDGYLSPAANYEVTINGVGFLDDITFDTNNVVVQWDGVNVTVINPGQSDIFIRVNNIPDAVRCLDTAVVTLYWDNITTTITCEEDYQYGPIVVSSAPNLGWEGDTVSITGDFFDDPDLYSGALTDVRVTFGAAGAGTTTSVSKNLIRVIAPPGAWLSDPTLVVSWPNLETCIDSTLTADDFHYGPIITAVVPTFGFVRGLRPTTIIGVGFTCCGLTNVIDCRWGGDSPIDPTTGTRLSDSAVSCLSGSRDTTIYNGPVDAAELDVFVGLRFNSTDSRIIDTGIEQDLEVDYHYGPLFSGVFPTFGRIRGDQQVTIIGAGFSDPFFLFNDNPTPFPTCLWEQDDGISELADETDVSFWSDSQIVCNSPEYVRLPSSCTFEDLIQVSFNTDLTNNPQFIRPSDDLLTHYYGPVISDISSDTILAFRGFVSGGELVTITASHLDEWLGREVKVLFANREIIRGDLGDEYAITSDSQSIVVYAPVGSFNYSGTIKLIWDYHNDDLTSYDYWHWTPFVTDISDYWAIEYGDDVIVLEGGGFCEYDTVICSFGGVEGWESDIAYDDRVVCRTPEASPATGAITLTFCDQPHSDDDCACDWLGTPDTAVTPGGVSFTFVGVSSISPTRGPYVGNTDVTFSGAGFSHFSAISCIFGDVGSVSAGNGTSDTSFICNSPSTDGQKVVNLRVQLTYTFSDGETQIFEIPGLADNPVYFHYGWPRIISINPDTGDVDDGDTVTLTGDLFNGGVVANIQCDWRQVDGSVLSTPSTDKTDTTVTCTAPVSGSLIGETLLSVSFNLGNIDSNAVVWEFTQVPTLATLDPTSGTEFGNTDVVLTGSEFNGAQDFCVYVSVDDFIVGTSAYTTKKRRTLGSSPRSVMQSGAQSISFKTPATNRDSDTLPANVDVSVSLDCGKTFSQQALTFTYRSGGSRTTDNPSGSFSSGNTNSGASALAPIASLLVVAFALLKFLF